MNRYQQCQSNFGVTQAKKEYWFLLQSNTEGKQQWKISKNLSAVFSKGTPSVPSCKGDLTKDIHHVFHDFVE